MNKQDILKLLKSISYPGFNRDIVSFGMVKDVEINNNKINISLSISSQNEEKKQSVVNDVKNILSKDFEEVNVLMVESNQSPINQNNRNQINQDSILKNVKFIIAVASGKGGVGKSTVAANLACAFKSSGKRVGLLDLDIYGPSLPIILGTNKQPSMNQEKKLIPIKRYDMEVMSFGFVSGSETPAIWRGPLVARMTEQFFRDVDWGKLDILVLDLPPGTGDVQLTLTQKLKISGAIIVTTPQDIALADVRKGADMFRKVNAPVLGVIENMSGFSINGQITDYNLSSSIKIDGKEVDVEKNGSFSFNIDIFKSGAGKLESERLGVPLLGQIPISQDIVKTTDGGVPIVEKYPESHLSKIYFQIANNIYEKISSN